MLTDSCLEAKVAEQTVLTLSLIVRSLSCANYQKGDGEPCGYLQLFIV